MKDKDLEKFGKQLQFWTDEMIFIVVICLLLLAILVVGGIALFHFWN
jgi:hypothetical protein